MRAYDHGYKPIAMLQQAETTVVRLDIHFVLEGALREEGGI